MNGNVFGNKTNHFRQVFRAYIQPFPFLQENINELAI